ncbi:MAG: hypothetical protein K0U59_02935 [Gammaproteobacteria bacterium]|nr:hypothetical protein [Gammaproteobacteria bacterium]
METEVEKHIILTSEWRFVVNVSRSDNETENGFSANYYGYTPRKAKIITPASPDVPCIRDKEGEVKGDSAEDVLNLCREAIKKIGGDIVKELPPGSIL